MRDLKIKEDSELPQIREDLKKTEAHWKSMQALLLEKLMGYSDNTKPTCDGTMPSPRIRLLNTLRFQVQMATITGLLFKEGSQACAERLDSFTKATSQSIVRNMIKFFRLHQLEKESLVIGEPKFSATSTIECEIASQEEETSSKFAELYDKKLDLYWLDIGEVSPSSIIKSKSKRIENAERQVNMKVILGVHNLKRSYREFIEFAESFSSYYERYFGEEAGKDEMFEILRNFGRILHIFLKGFHLPGRVQQEDIRDSFVHQFKMFKLHLIFQKLAAFLKPSAETTVSLSNTRSWNSTLTQLKRCQFSATIFSGS